jgi:hypothetical protein
METLLGGIFYWSDMFAFCETELHFWALSQNLWKRLLASWGPVRPSVRMEQLGSHWKDFHEILYFSKIKVKVKFTPEQATKANRGSSGIALRFL